MTEQYFNAWFYFKNRSKLVLFLDPDGVRADVSHIFNDSLRDWTLHAPFLLFNFGKLRI